MTTLVPILSELLVAKNTTANKIILFSVYAPYLVVPAVLLWQFLIHNPLFVKKRKAT